MRNWNWFSTVQHLLAVGIRVVVLLALTSCRTTDAQRRTALARALNLSPFDEVKVVSVRDMTDGRHLYMLYGECGPGPDRLGGLGLFDEGKLVYALKLVRPDRFVGRGSIKMSNDVVTVATTDGYGTNFKETRYHLYGVYDKQLVEVLQCNGDAYSYGGGSEEERDTDIVFVPDALKLSLLAVVYVQREYVAGFVTVTNYSGVLYRFDNRKNVFVELKGGGD